MKLKALMLMLVLPLPAMLSAQNSLDEVQSPLVRFILSKETSVYHTTNLINILNNVDATYRNLYANLKKGKKIKIYFYPAHGKLPDGRWQGGAASQRLSCTKKPEEFYSIPIARELYRLFKNNPYIEIQSRADYLQVLEGRSDSYSHAPSIETIQEARDQGAFLMLSEHLNNVAKTTKADGLVQLRGIHISNDDWGNRYLIESNFVYSGFLTIYNKFDASGLSMEYARILKANLVAKGMQANGWEYGTVGFDRFYYFAAFPFSIIYESGFISNPVEEKMLQNPDKIQMIASAQYDAFIRLLRLYFGISFAEDKLSYKHVYNHDRIELLKLSRIIGYYIHKTDTAKALLVIGLMETKYRATAFNKYIYYYQDVKRRIARAEQYYAMGKKYAKRKLLGKARTYYRNAMYSIKPNDFYSAYMTKYNDALLGKKIIVKKQPQDAGVPKTAENKSLVKNAIVKKPATKEIKLVTASQASLTRPIILTIEHGQTLANALEQALGPDSKTLSRLVYNFKNAKTIHYTWHSSYSKKKKRWVGNKRKVVRKIWFTYGIYIVTVDKNLQVTSAVKVTRVRLLPWKYQNQQYLKNSSFSSARKIKNI